MTFHDNINNIVKRNYISTRESKAFFERSVIKYSKPDIRALLEAKLDCAGPLLEVIVNGIDNLGGICYGFSEGSMKRSVRFMKEKMNFSDALAKFLYTIVRCGIAHQGMPKIGVIYFVEYDYPEKEKIFCKDSKDNIWLNVVGLAQHYLDTIDALNEDTDKYDLDVPPINCREEAIFEKAKNEIKYSIDDMAFDIGNKRMQKEHPGASYAAYSATGTLKICIDSPDDFA